MRAYWIEIGFNPGNPVNPGGPTQSLEVDVTLSLESGWREILIEQNSWMSKKLSVETTNRGKDPALHVTARLLGRGESLFVGLKGNSPFKLYRPNNTFWDGRICNIQHT
ncbi:hypothetical protein QFC20_006716 [Naganishia adeliensis]|uniref:Uncharacterized protein n=1 Tax=Naganishia adeliensis TaxID=92952 RepID=A0ACC2V9D8_9TREE|nr:hypothetical protein QFC20_006716 [Naganishia adeliensis]